MNFLLPVEDHEYLLWGPLRPTSWRFIDTFLSGPLVNACFIAWHTKSIMDAGYILFWLSYSLGVIPAILYRVRQKFYVYARLASQVSVFNFSHNIFLWNSTLFILNVALHFTYWYRATRLGNIKASVSKRFWFQIRRILRNSWKDVAIYNVLRQPTKDIKEDFESLSLAWRIWRNLQEPTPSLGKYISCLVSLIFVSMKV